MNELQPFPVNGRVAPYRTMRVLWVALCALCGALGLMAYASPPEVGAAPVTAEESHHVFTETLPFVVEYPLPAHLAAARPHHIIAEAPGRLWFTLPGVNALGALVVTTTVDFAFAAYPLPTADSDPHDLVLDEAAGLIWLTQRGVDKIGRFNIATQQIDEFAMPTGSQPTGIALASNGLIWLTFPGTNQIASFNPTTETVSTFNYPRANGGFAGIKVSSNGLVWAVATTDNRLVSFNPSNQVFINVVVGNFGAPPIPPHSLVMQGITPWITVPSTGWIGRYSPGTLNLWFWYVTGATENGPTALALRQINSDHEFWYLQPSSNRAGRMLISGQGQGLEHFLASLPTADSQPTGITVDGNGHAWVTATAANAIVEWRPPYTIKTFLPIISR